MGKLNMNLLKGIEEQEKTIDNSKAYQEEEQFLELLRQNKSRKEAYEPSQSTKNMSKEEKAEEKANTKAEKQTFSFRAEQSKIENWKLYAETIGTKEVGTLWTAAIDEYISNHELTADQQIIYDLKKKATEMQRNQK